MDTASPPPASLNNPSPFVDPEVAGQPRVVRMLACLKSILIKDETLEAWCVQRRLFALTGRRALVGVTSGRLIVMSRRLLSGYDPVHIRWQDLREVKLNVGLFGADLTFRAGSGSDLAGDSSEEYRLVCPGLRKQQAREAYRLCQAHDQAWREKRRIREIEEMRARSGAIQISTAGGAIATNTAAGQPSSDPVQRLQSARQMLEAALISDSEFESIRARIVNNL